MHQIIVYLVININLGNLIVQQIAAYAKIIITMMEKMKSAYLVIIHGK